MYLETSCEVLSKEVGGGRGSWRGSIMNKAASSNKFKHKKAG
jgi:hypothetical protein